MKRAVDIEQPGALVSYLRGASLLTPAEEVETETLAGGVSNRTVLVRLIDRGGAWVVKQALPKLRVAVDWFSRADRIHREALSLRWLAALLPPGTVPAFVFEDFENHLLVMEAVEPPYENWKAMLLRGELEGAHVKRFGEILGSIHAYSAVRAAELAPRFGDKSYFEELRLEPYYYFTAEQVPAARDCLLGLIEECRQRSESLVHGDYSPKNVLVRRDSMVLLDFEVTHFGDPAFDIGFGLTHLLGKANHLREHREAFGRAAKLYWGSYLTSVHQAALDGGLEQRAVRHTVGCLLARVRGRSPLEYLSEEERLRQERTILEVIEDLPMEIPRLIDEFVGSLT